MIALKPHPRVPRPIPKRLPRRKYVTIAAGFCCKDGMVIAADSQETTLGYMKGEKEKIRYCKMSAWSIAVVGAGDSTYVEMCMDKILYHFCRDETSPVPH